MIEASIVDGPVCGFTTLFYNSQYLQLYLLLAIEHLAVKPSTSSKVSTSLIFPTNTCSSISCLQSSISLTFHLAFKPSTSTKLINTLIFHSEYLQVYLLLALEHFPHFPSGFQAIDILQGQQFFNFSFPIPAILSNISLTFHLAFKPLHPPRTDRNSLSFQC